MCFIQLLHAPQSSTLYFYDTASVGVAHDVGIKGWIVIWLHPLPHVGTELREEHHATVVQVHGPELLLHLVRRQLDAQLAHSSLELLLGQAAILAPRPAQKSRQPCGRRACRGVRRLDAGGQTCHRHMKSST